MENTILNQFYQMLDKGSNEVNAVAIVISKEGVRLDEILDGKPYNHATAFNYLASKLGLSYFETVSPLEAAKNLTSQGAIAIQIRVDICVVYFPDSIIKAQYDELEDAVCYKKDLLYSFDTEEGFFALEDVLDYASSLIVDRTK